MGTYQKLSSSIVRIFHPSYPIFEASSLVYYKNFQDKFYATVVSAREFEAKTGKLNTKQEKNFHKGRFVCIRDIYGHYSIMEAELLHPVRNPAEDLGELCNRRDKEADSKRVEIVKTIEFLEEYMRITQRS